MTAFAQDSGSSNYGNFLPGAAVGAVGGIAAYAGVDVVRQAASDAKVGKWGALGLGLFSVFAGNSALNLSNSAMTKINTITASGALVAGDTPNVRGALQDLAQAVKELTPGGYTGISTVVSPSTSPSLATVSTTGNSAALLIAALGVGYLLTR